MTKRTHHIKFFIVPSLLLITFLIYLPLIYSFILSFQTGRGNNLEFGGFSNYINLINDVIVRRTLVNSLIFTVIIVPSIILLSIYLAYKINKLKSEKMQNIVTTIIYIPCITSPVAYSLFFKQVSYSDGILSNIIRNIGFLDSNFNILQNAWSARLLIALVCVWAWTGFYTLILYIAMKNTDPSIIKAAKIDGASDLKTLRKIILPTVKPILYLITVLITINTFQIFVESMLITNGGPGVSTYTLIYYLYNRAFVFVPRYGYASALGVLIFVICFLLNIGIIKRGIRNEQKN